MASEQFGNSGSGGAPINRQALQCALGAYMTNLTAYNIEYDVQDWGSFQYIGEFRLQMLVRFPASLHHNDERGAVITSKAVHKHKT